MPPAGRLGDLSVVPLDKHGCPKCPHSAVGPAVSGSSNVNINSRPALRVGDPGIHAACCGPNTWTAQTGSPTVFINGKKAHRMFDIGSHCGGKGLLITGSTNVIIGGGFDVGGLGMAALGQVAGAAGAAVANTLAGPLQQVSQHLSEHFGPIVTNAVTGALQGAVQGAVSGAIQGLVTGGLPGALSGALQGAAGGALQGAINGAIQGLQQELSKTLADARAEVERDIQKKGLSAFKEKKDELYLKAKMEGIPKGLEGYFNSPLHRQYAATVEYLSGGKITFEEALWLNPSGGITGPGAGGLQIEGGIIGTHSVRHDAQGFLRNTFDVGPGYGGLFPNLPVSGQVVGVIREVVSPTQLPPPPPVALPPSP